jgi:hypothetical protein
MIMKALEGGVTEAQIAQALDIDVRKIVLGKNLLEGLHAEAIQILKDKPITARALNILKQVKALRQIEMAQLTRTRLPSRRVHKSGSAAVVGLQLGQLRPQREILRTLGAHDRFAPFGIPGPLVGGGSLRGRSPTTATAGMCARGASRTMPTRTSCSDVSRKSVKPGRRSLSRLTKIGTRG